MSRVDLRGSPGDLALASTLHIWRVTSRGMANHHKSSQECAHKALSVVLHEAGIFFRI